MAENCKMTVETEAPFSLNPRQEQILALTEAHGFVKIDDLAESFGVSAQTVRRDIIALSDAGLLQRFHGGAGAVGGGEALRLDHGRKTTISIQEKSKVAQAAARLVPEGSTVFLDVGTTVEAAALELRKRQSLQVFTSSLRAALQFDPTHHDVRVLGGRLAGRDGSLVGEEVVMALAGLRIDIALLGCSAIDRNGQVMDFDLSKIAVKKAAMRSARASYLLATPSKFGRSALAIFAQTGDFTQVIDGRD